MALASIRASLAVKLVAVIYLMTTLFLLILFVRSKTNKESLLDKDLLFQDPAISAENFHTNKVHLHNTKETKKEKSTKKNTLNNYVRKFHIPNKNATSSIKIRRYTITKKVDSKAVVKISNNFTPKPVTRLLNYLKYKSDNSETLWPIENGNDRIIDQILYYKPTPPDSPMKLIYTTQDFDSSLVQGQERFLEHKCLINTCSITHENKDKDNADLILMKDIPDLFNDVSNQNQVKLLFLLESPFNTGDFSRTTFINWTASYRSDSVLTAPYERFTYFKNFTQLPVKAPRNYAYSKTKKVAWFVSNCFGDNGRINYAKELSKYIEVDIYGDCGDKVCARNDEECFELLKKTYKFYLSFENSNCREYITEKFYVNALRNDVVPIVMGAPIEDYQRLAPPYSFIHVDSFKSPKELAEYLNVLDKDDDQYNSYFRWKGAGEIIDTKFWCRLCGMLHYKDETNVKMWYKELNEWWRGKGICVEPTGKKWASWRNIPLKEKSVLKRDTYEILYDKHQTL